MQRKHRFLPLLTALLLLSVLVSCQNGSGDSTDTSATATEPTVTTGSDTDTTAPIITETTSSATVTATTASQPTETTVGAHDHVYLEQITAPTCAEGGYTTYTCYLCHDSYRGTETPAAGHHYISEIIYPTGTEQGYTEYTCTICAHSYRDNYTDPVSRVVVVMFDRAGGTMEGYDTRIYHTGDQVELPVPTRDGYTFLGWYLGEELVESGIWSIPNSITLTAEWELNRYRITYDANGGTVGYPYGTVSYGETFGTLPTPDDRFGYQFIGWYDGDRQITAETVSDYLSDITLTARWNPPQGTGEAGKDLTWTLCGDGVVRLTGSGTAIAEGAFAGMEELTAIEIPSTVRDIGAGAFENCVNLKEITIPGSVGVLRSSLFAGCTSLTSVTLGSGISVINEDVFTDCSSLTTLTLPLSLFQIYDHFSGCTSLHSIRYEGGDFEWSVVVKAPATLEALSAEGLEYTFGVSVPQPDDR